MTSLSVPVIITTAYLKPFYALVNALSEGENFPQRCDLWSFLDIKVETKNVQDV